MGVRVRARHRDRPSSPSPLARMVSPESVGESPSLNRQDSCSATESDRGKKFERIERELRDREALQKKVTLSIIEKPWFEGAVSLVVALNALTMGLEADYPGETTVWIITENLFTLIFFGEMITKLCVMRFRYFHDWWNMLDMILVLSAVVDTWILSLMSIQFDMQQLSIVRMCRLVRLVRVIKLMHNFRRLVLVLYGVIEAIQTLFWVGSVLFIIVYVAAVFCVGFFSKETNELYPGYTTDVEQIDGTDLMNEFNPHLCFGNMRAAMFTLFNLAIQAEWGEIVRPIMVKQPLMVLFLIFFVLVVSLGIMNVIVGMVADNVIENAETLKRSSVQNQTLQQMEALRQIHIHVSELDTDGSGCISVEELDRELMQRHSRILELLDRVGLHLPKGFSAEELICLLDTDGDGKLEVDSFVESFYRIIDSGAFQQICMLQSGINSLKRIIKDANRSNDTKLESIDFALQRLLAKDAATTGPIPIHEYAEPFPALSAPLHVTMAPAAAGVDVPESFKVMLGELEATMRQSDHLLAQLAAAFTGTQPAECSPGDQSGRAPIWSPAMSSFTGCSWTTASTKVVEEKMTPPCSFSSVAASEERMPGQPLLEASTRHRPHVVVSLPHTGGPRDDSHMHSPAHLPRQPDARHRLLTL